MQTHTHTHTHTLTNDFLAVFHQQVLNDRSELFDGFNGLEIMKGGGGEHIGRREKKTDIKTVKLSLAHPHTHSVWATASINA